jgi:tRNA-dihydrouridine synthase
MVEHTDLFEKLYLSGNSGHTRNGIKIKNLKNFDVMKKHYKAYANGFDGAKELRVKLMQVENALEVRNVAKAFLKDQGMELK